MIFHSEEPIDDTLLSLVKKLKTLTRKNPKLSWVKDRDVWLITVKDWLSSDICIIYSRLSSEKFTIFIPDVEGAQTLGYFQESREVVNSLILMNFMEKGVSSPVIEFIATKIKNPRITVQEAVNSIMAETDIIVTTEEMHVLGIETKQRGTVIGRQFGI